jgi:adenylate cyclase
VHPRLRRALRHEELRGLVFAFRARCIAAAAVAVWLVVLVPSPRDLYYLGVVGLFVGLGLVPHLARHKPYGQAVKLICIALDVLLITAVILVPPPFDTSTWPVQTRLRFQDYLYLLIYLAGSALSYSALNVVWTGLCIVGIWSAGFLSLLWRPDTVTWAKRMGDRTGVPSEEALAVILDPRYVMVSQLWNQIALTLVMTGLLVAAVLRARQTAIRQARAEVVRADLARYLSPDVAETLAKRSGAAFGAPATRPVAVLFADIVGFTALCEKLAPEDVVSLLRSFHVRSCRIVFRHGGTLDKFLGDGLMATFGALSPSANAAEAALHCALALQEEMDRWARKRQGRGAAAFTISVGVHFGPAVVGNVGAEQRLEFTVVGDTVNVANRLERLTRDFACRTAVSREVLEAAGRSDRPPEGFTARGPVTVRGRAAPVEVFTCGSSRAAGSSSVHHARAHAG